MSSCFAFKLSPMNLYFGPQKSKIRKIVTISNAKNKGKVAIKLFVTRRAIDKYGKESRVLSDELRVYPRQVILAPGAIQNIRLSFRGDLKQKSEASYRLIAEQLPIKDYIVDESAGIKILLKYAAALYFTPKNAKSKLKVIGFSDNKMILKNIGEKHLIIKNIKFLNNKDKLIFENPKEIVGINLLAKSERIFHISKKISSEQLKKLKVLVNY